jgi:hypothetical protein
VGLAIVGLAGVGSFLREANAASPSRLQLALIAVGAVAGCFLGAVKTLQSRYKDAKEDKKESPDTLRGCLHVIHGTVAGLKKVASPGGGWLRITLHRVDGDTLEQSVDYVGSEDGGAGRSFPIFAGVSGRVARRKEARTFDRPADMSFDEWVRYLVDEVGMTDDRAMKTRRDRFAFFGVPIKSPGGKDVRAVVYLDAGTPGFFDSETMAVIIDGCAGLAAWIDEHYYSRR